MKVLIYQLTDMELYHLNKSNTQGQSLIELLIAMGLMAILIPALTYGFITSAESKPQNDNRISATALVNEGKEALRIARENGWSPGLSGTYHPVQSGNTWTILSGNETLGIYTRSINIEDVYRDSNNNIVTTGGTLDTSTKKVEVLVEWNTPRDSQLSATSYFTRYLNNSAWIQTTQTDFDNGTYANTESTNDYGVNDGRWDLPNIVSTVDVSGRSNTNAVFVQGNYAYFVTANGGSSPDFIISDISNPTYPVVESTIDTGIDNNDIHVAGNYAYTVSDSDTQEFTVYDVTDKSNPIQVATVDTPGTSDAFGMFISGNYAYVVQQSSASDPEFSVIDITDPLDPEVIGTYEVGSNAYDVYVKGDYAYIVTSSNSQELQVIDISIKTAPVLAGAFDIASGANARCVFVRDSNVFVGTSNSASEEVSILDASNVSSISQIGAFEVGNQVNDIYANPEYMYLTTNLAGQQFMVVDISTIASPTLYGSANLEDNAAGVAIKGDYAYVGSSNNNAELNVVFGGNGNLDQGTVILQGASSEGSWETPEIVDELNVSGSGDGFTVDVEGNYAYLGREDNGSSADFVIVDITDPTNISQQGSLNIGASINLLRVSGNYVYAATDADNNELQIFNVTNKNSPSIASTLNLGNGRDAYGIDQFSGYALVTKQAASSSNRELYIVDATTPGSPTEISNYEVGVHTRGIKYVSPYIYLATASNTKELVIVDATNPLSLSEAGSFNTAGGGDGVALDAVGTTVYLGTYSQSGDDFFIIDVSNPAFPNLIGSYNVGGDVFDIRVVGTLAFLATSNTSTEFLVLDLTDPSNPGEYGSVNLPSTAYGIAVSGDYAYLATAGNELIVIEGGSGNFQTSGTYTSDTLNAGAQVAFNNIDLQLNEPAGTDIQVQIAVNNDNTTWNYIGPDGTSGTYYEGSQSLNLANILGQYLRFRAYFTSAGIVTPVLEGVSINYSP